ncbi:MAG: hypothetical protein LBG45_02665 [Dysgonamonadaceae bacterium]|jgi:hypothetical protein|nr:hypothetical protein [Dysgonamonadaceae bacterium]
MARNKIEDLNDHLFAVLERLNDEELHGDSLAEEIDRSKAIVNVSGKVIDSMKVQSDLFCTMMKEGYRPHVPEQFKNMLPEKTGTENGSK